MARKPNYAYAFERKQRAKIKAEKREAKREAKRAAQSKKKEAESDDSDTADLPQSDVGGRGR